MPYRNGVNVQWRYHVKVKHLFTKEESPDAVRESMNAIYEALKAHGCFDDFEMLDYFKGQEDVEEANGLLDEMYDYADMNLIWIE